MTDERRAQIEKAAKEYCPDRTVELPNGEELYIVHARATGFIAGATWADENPGESATNDYKDMRLFQERFMKADHELRETQSQLTRYRSALEVDEILGPDRRYDLHDKILECDKLRVENEQLRALVRDALTKDWVLNSLDSHHMGGDSKEVYSWIARAKQLTGGKQ